MRIEDWEIKDPVNRLVHRLNQLDSRNTQETTDALLRFKAAIERCGLEVEIAAQRFIIDTSRDNEMAARTTLDVLQREYDEKFPS